MRTLPACAPHIPSSQRAVCAGDQFALFESVVALAMLVRRFDFSMAPSAPAVGMTTVRLYSNEGTGHESRQQMEACLDLAQPHGWAREQG